MKMTKEQALAFKRQWKHVSEFQLNELRSSTPEKKIKQLNVLMRWAKDFGWTDKLKSEESDVRERWIRLKNHYQNEKK